MKLVTELAIHTLIKKLDTRVVPVGAVIPITDEEIAAIHEEDSACRDRLPRECTHFTVTKEVYGTVMQGYKVL